MRLYFPLFFSFLFLGHALWAQKEEQEGSLPAAFLIDINYAFHLPEGDMKADYYQSNSAGGQLAYLSPKNWIFGLSGQVIFADRVKTDVLAPLREANGELISLYGDMGLTQLGQRGFIFTGQIGKLVSLNKKNRRHNLEFRLGAGYMEHWVRIRLMSREEELPQLQGDYIKGYDQRRAGLSLQQFVGYRYMSRNRMLNLFVGLDLNQAFTTSVRGWDYHLRQADTSTQFDVLYGLRAGFCIPFFIYTENTRSDELKFY